MEQNISRERKIDDIRTSYAILMSQTRALCEVLRTYSEDKMGSGDSVDLSATTLMNFMFQVDDNLKGMEDLVSELDCQ